MAQPTWPTAASIPLISPKSRVLRLVAGIVAVLAALLVGAATQAQGSYPQRIGPHINDFAGLLTTKDAADIQTMFDNLKRERGVEAVVVTIKSIQDYDTGDTTIESFATNLFNTWGIGDRQRNDGVLILVAVRDRRVRIALGSGYPSSTNEDMQVVIDQQMLPSFKRNAYSQGIADGARALVAQLTGNLSPQIVQASPLPAQIAPALATPYAAPLTVVESSEDTAPAAPPAQNQPLIMLGGLIGIIAAALGLKQYARYRKRRCPECQTFMRRLDEASAAEYLDSGQQVEQSLGSVEYDVWHCPSCDQRTVRSYMGWGTSFQKCPQCRYYTVLTNTQTVSWPTSTATGKQITSRDCRHCSYHDEKIVILPKTYERSRSFSSSSSHTHSSSSFSSSSSHTHSSSSFSDSSSSSSDGGGHSGGGHSDGGGASGSW